jgi:uncharacterized protein YgbK (DUF1537 family)
MIAVIADDLTGAAELGGIGLTYGLHVEIAMSVNPQSTADLLVIATDARSVSEPEAVQEMTRASKALLQMKPRLIFKKVDSVLRGHVIAETQAQLVVFGVEKALIVPANPALGRTLINGTYYVNGQPIDQTHFSEDPEFPITDSDVLRRLSVNFAQLTVQPHTTELPKQGIVIGEVSSTDDLRAWAKRVDTETMIGGGSGFFTAILNSLKLPEFVSKEPAKLGETRLYVCGSAFGERVALVKKAADAGQAVSYMPNTLTHISRFNESDLAGWVAEIVGCFQQYNQVIIAIEPGLIDDDKRAAVHLRTVMAMAVSRVLSETKTQELIIEGGSTASAVLRAIGVTRLVPVQELAPGVVRSDAIEKDSLHITVKPGSYRWPADLWTC